jgi:hypothetical protein
MRTRVIVPVAVVALLVAAYFASPYWVMYEMRSAAQNGQGDKLAAYVDFPAVRESLKTQFALMMNKSVADDPKTKDNPFAAFGQMLAAAMLGPMVDRMVTPESLASMMANGKASNSVPRPAKDDPTPAEPGKAPRIVREYEGLDVFKVSIHAIDDDKETVTFVLNRQGLFSWKLTSIRMPALIAPN